MKTIIKSILILLIINLSVVSNAQRRVKNKSNISEQDILLSLEVHNKAREDVGTPPLKWSVKLANDAQKYAEYLARRNRGLLHSSSRNGQGENLYMWYTTGNTNSSNISTHPCEDASYAWYNEIKYYRYKKVRKHRIGPKVGHYTQMIWRSTEELGIGWAVSKTGKVYVVARYYKAGNMIGKRPY